MAADQNRDQVGMRRHNSSLFTCGIDDCRFIASHVRRLVIHISTSHIRGGFIRKRCYVDGCESRFLSGKGLRDHMQRYHKDMWYAALPAPATVPERDQGVIIEGMEDFVDGIDPEETAFQRYDNFILWLHKETLRVRLAIEHEHEMPASKVKQVHFEIQEFLLAAFDKMQSALFKRLDEIQVNDDGMLSLLRGKMISKALHCTKTEAKCWFKKEGYIAPLEIDLNSDDVDCSNVLENEDSDVDDPDECDEWADCDEGADCDDGGDSEDGDDCENGDDCEEQEDYDGGEGRDESASDGEESGTQEGSNCRTRPSGVMHYVPILETLKRYLSFDDVVDSIMEETIGDHIDKYSAGAMFHSHPIFKDNPKALRIILYADEFEVCNPLGGAKGTHKVLGVYFSVGNIEQHHLSSLSSIHLALLCEYPNVVHYKHDRVLRPLIRDLKKLETEGITVVTRGGKEYSWKGGLAFICGDNKSQHELLGMRRTFSSGRICRFCMADYRQLDDLLSEEDCVLRTPAAHAMHLAAALANPEENISLYGVAEPSPFAALQVPSITELFAPDIMHDSIQGLVTFHLTELIRSLHRRRVVRLPSIINALNRFKYGKNLRDSKPRSISSKFMSKKTKISGSAAQKWTLFHIFSLAVGPLVPQDDEHWQLFLLVNRICDVIFAPVVDRDWLPHLTELIEEHHRLWVKLYPGKMVYKIHTLLHYARIMYLMGPLRLMWNMRFESFHQYFIRMAKKIGNYINITKTLAERFQRRYTVQHSGGTGLPPKFRMIGAQYPCILLEMPERSREALTARFQCEQSTQLVQVKSVVYCGLKCFLGDFVVVSVASDEVPTFLKIVDIVLLQGTVILIGQLAYVLLWNAHLHAYEVQVSNDKSDFVCVEIDKVCSPQTLDAYSVEGRLCVKVQFQPVS